MGSKSTAGFVIAIDGPDGAGKSVQVKLIAEYYKTKGRTVHTTRSSGGTPIGEELRKVSLSDHPRPATTDLFISLAMGAALAEDIATRKERGEIIIIDRSPLAVVAYNGYGSQLEDKQAAFKACEVLLREEKIDLLVFLTASTEVLENRRQQRGTDDYFEAQGADYHTRVDEGYAAGLEFVENGKTAGLKVVKIDAGPSIETVHESILKAVP